jgi:hypothetical protein
MRTRAMVLLLLAMLAAPAVASALTVADIVALTKAGVSDTVILALIDRDKPIFTIAPDDLVALKSDGVSEPVVLAMLRSGREDTPAPPPPPAETLFPLPPAEPIVVVGSGPDRPHVGRPEDSVNYGTPYMVPYVVPVPVPGRSFRPRRFNRDVPVPQPFVPQGPTLAPVPQQRTFVPTTGIFFQGTPHGIFFNPPVQQPR